MLGSRNAMTPDGNTETSNGTKDLGNEITNASADFDDDNFEW